MSTVKYLKETTDTWTTAFKMPNHIYILDGTTCMGYIKQGTEVEEMFNHPLKNFDKRGRTFKELKTRKQVNEVIYKWLK